MRIVNHLVDPQKVNDKETCPRCMHPWDAHTEDLGCAIGHTNQWCQCDYSLRKYLEGIEQTSENRALALMDWEADANQLRVALVQICEEAKRQYPVSIGNQHAWAKIHRIAESALNKPDASQEQERG